MQKTILITGSTDGIGKLAAIKLAEEGHEIYLHGRNQEKLLSVIEEVKAISKNQNIKGFIADFSDLDSVRQMTQQINKELSKIDVLINNAGIFKSAISQNKQGLNLRFMVNYLAPYLLTNKLIPLLQKGTDSQIINLSSAAQSSISYEALLGKERLSENETYAQSKLALTMWSFYLANELENVSVIAVNPGSLLNTKMANEAYGTHWSSADKGANILYDLAISDEHHNITGKYFDNDSETYAEAHPDAYDEGAIHKLIDVTNKLIKG